LSEGYLLDIEIIPTVGEPFVLHTDQGIVVFQESQRHATQDDGVGIGMAAR
jgi:hypothetical protein